MKQTELVKLKEMLAKLTYGQRQELMKSWASGDDYERCVEILETQQNERVCPHCGSDHLVRNGSASDLQRYKCRGCDRTFNMLTGTSLARLRQKSKWLAQADVLREGISIRQAQKRLFVARSTAFRWRHRFLSAQKTVQAQALVGIAEADETFFLHSRKGQHGLDRTPRRRGGKAAKRGLSKEQVPVLIARDRGHATASGHLEKPHPNPQPIKFTQPETNPEPPPMKIRSAIKTDLFAADLRKQKIDRLGDPLLAFEEHIDFAALAGDVDRTAPRPEALQGGRPPFPTETMVRVLFLKRFNNLSDEQIEYQLLDRMSYQRFCGLSDSASIPDRTTVWTFENRIGEAGAVALFKGIDVQLLKQGYIARGGQIIDATLIPAPKQHFSKDDKTQLKQDALPADWNKYKRRQKDINATWTKKHGKSYHGYKLSVNIDKRYKVIRQIVTDTASTHDSQHFDAVLDSNNTCKAVYADKGYPSAEREAKLKAAGLRNHIQRKGARNHPLSACQERRNKRIAKTRARVEHIFAGMEQMGGKLIRTIGQARANFAMTMMAACYNLKRLSYFKRVGMGAF